MSFLILQGEPIHIIREKMWGQHHHTNPCKFQISQQAARFLLIWLESYGTFNHKHFTRNSGQVPDELALIFTHLVHIEKTSLTMPRSDLELYHRHYNISSNYVVHLWNKHNNVIPQNEEELRHYNCTLGDAMKYILK